jgi:two-component system, sensor histidine kinase
VASANTAKSHEPLQGTVLVAEDNKYVRAVIELYLTDLGLAYRCAANGLEAVEAAFGGAFDVLLMDVEMPIMDGYEAVRMLRERGYRGPILAFTAHREGTQLERARQEGFNGIVIKPVTMEQLRDALKPFLPSLRRLGN